ncbi:PilZ domain-containing protein [Porphyrobacter sp. CACIAM 03H1]|uniref:PilZ domain-containing protein n=1 Tax=Porphyrobacter sp. CACIAM 03H1 TaxID=2003315 RepID=UPI00155F995F|nr:PilZ domain-containing protein [Porphyrobacter sp. CACIAM 03H1]
MVRNICDINRRNLAAEGFEQDERAFERHRTFIAVTLRGATGNVYPATIENISFAGCMASLQLADRIKRERVISVRFGASVHVIGRVVWSRNNQVGLRFTSLFDRNRIAADERPTAEQEISSDARSALRLVPDETSGHGC